MPPVEYRGMKCRRVGPTTLWASEVGLGMWKYGDPSYDGSRIGEHEAFEVLDRALELGVFFWDTANSYNMGSGNSERLLGRYFNSRPRSVREQVVVATKVSNSVREEHQLEADFTPNQSGCSRLYVMNMVHACLRRLQTDHIDILYLHTPYGGENFAEIAPEAAEREILLDETWSAMDDLVTQGKVRYLAVSNHDTGQIQEVRDALARVGKDGSRRIIAVQNRYNMLERDKVAGRSGRGTEAEFLDYCRDNRIGIVPYFPLASGALTGRYRRDNLDQVEGRITTEGTADQFLTDRNLDIIEQLAALAEQMGVSMAQLAIAWLLSREGVCSVIAGVTKLEHLEENAKAPDVQLSESDLAAIEGIVGG